MGLDLHMAVDLIRKALLKVMRHRGDLRYLLVADDDNGEQSQIRIEEWWYGGRERVNWEITIRRVVTKHEEVRE